MFQLVIRFVSFVACSSNSCFHIMNSKQYRVIFVFSCFMLDAGQGTSKVLSPGQALTQKVREAIAQGTEINTHDEQGISQLHWAVYFGECEAITLILETLKKRIGLSGTLAQVQYRLEKPVKLFSQDTHSGTGSVSSHGGNVIIYRPESENYDLYSIDSGWVKTAISMRDSKYWSPDGSRVLLPSDADAHIMSSHGIWLGRYKKQNYWSYEGWSPDSSKILEWYGYSVRIYNNQGAFLIELADKSAIIDSASWCQDSLHIITININNEIHLWKLSESMDGLEGHVVKKLHSRNYHPRCYVCPRTTLLLIEDAYLNVELVDWEEQKRTFIRHSGSERKYFNTLWNKDGMDFLTVRNFESGVGSINLWSRDGKIIAHKDFEKGVRTVRWSPDGSEILIVSGRSSEFIVFESGSELFIYTRDLMRLVHHKIWLGNVEYAEWDKTGTRLFINELINCEIWDLGGSAVEWAMRKGECDQWLPMLQKLIELCDNNIQELCTRDFLVKLCLIASTIRRSQPENYRQLADFLSAIIRRCGKVV